MSDWFYSMVCALATPPVWISSSPLVIGEQNTHRKGAFILASTHSSPYDIPVVMRHCARHLDFVSITEIFEKPLIGWLYGMMNAFPLDRSRPDSPTVRTILRRLERGRVVAMFPEGGFRRGEASVIHSRRLKPGIGRIAKLAQAPIVPSVVINSGAYSRVASWLPFFQTRYGVIFGEAIEPDVDPNRTEERLIDSFVTLHAALSSALAAAAPSRHE